MLAYADEDGREQAIRRGWTALRREKVFFTIADADQGVLNGSIIDVAEGYRWIIKDTFFNRSQSMPVYGPMSPQNYEARKAIRTSGPYLSFMVQQGHLILDPTPAAMQQLAFMYQSKNFAESADASVRRNSFMVDTDVFMLDEETLTLGVLWRYKQKNGFEYAEDQRKYEMRLLDAASRDEVQTTSSMWGDSSSGDPADAGLPEGNW